MFWGRFLFFSYLCIGIVKVRSDNPYTEDLVNEYYTVIEAANFNYIPQDDIDAQTIVDSDRDNKVVASILLYREKSRRYAINEKILERYQPKGSQRDRRRQAGISSFYWITDSYRLQYTSLRDVYFALIKSESQVLATYLEDFFNNKDETWITIALILTKDMERLKGAYGWRMFATASDTRFEDKLEDQRRPYRNMLRVWVRNNRESIEKEDLNKDNVKKDAEALKKEQDSKDGWHEVCRDQLELILMKKSIKYARAVIEEFEKANEGRAIEDIINDHIKSHKLNHDLADAYSSLARYIKDKYKYIADLLGKFTDGSQWNAWVMCVAVVHPQEWPNIDKAFKETHKNQSLIEYFSQNLSNDKTMAEVFGVIMDQKFKPTTFSEKPVQEESKKPAR